jgi:hypothetical protein
MMSLRKPRWKFVWVPADDYEKGRKSTYAREENAMEIVDLCPEYEGLFFVCLEDWSEEMKEAGDNREKWYREMKMKG